MLATLCCNLFIHYNSDRGENANNLITNTIKNLCIEILVLPYKLKSDYNNCIFFQRSNLDNGVIFLNCDFRIKVNGNNKNDYIKIFEINCVTAASSIKSNITFRSCIFNIEARNCVFKLYSYRTGRAINNFIFDKCMINLKCINIQNSTHNTMFSAYNTYVEDCGIYIENNSDYPLFLCDYVYNNSSTHYYYFGNSYIIYKSDSNKGLYLTNGSSTTASYLDSLFRTKCFYDKEISNGLLYEKSSSTVTIEDKCSNMLALTTEQCKDAAYLASIGFGIST